jgi:Na+-translocating ferredoxin:NAD+ oxidoreductase RnfG subunit
MMINWLKKYYPLFFLVIVIVISSALMMGAEKINRAVMESRQDPATLALLQQIFSNATFYSYSVNEEIYTIYNSSRHKIGYAMYGEDYGYRSKITVLAGLSDKETIKNIIIISQSEDLAYWNRLVANDFFDQFIDLDVEECYPSYASLPGGVDAASGATYSSRGVTNAVRDAILDKLEYLD